MKQYVLFLLVALVALSCVATAHAEDGFLLREDALPRARVGEHEVIFRRNGAFVLRRDGAILGDGGLVFATPGWKEWGTQIRRSGQRDVWEPSDDGQAMTFRGTLYDIDSRERFKIVQTVSFVPDGLRFKYRIVPLRMDDLHVLGMVWHLPTADTHGAHVAFAPGDTSLTLPETHTKGVLQTASAASLTMQYPSGDILTVTRETPLQWMATDDRTWNLNTFRLVGNCRDLLPVAGKGGAVEFTVDVALGYDPPKTGADKTAPTANETKTQATFSAEGPLVVPLPDDTFTRGDWLGSYGTFAYYLCAKRSPHSLAGGKGWPWQIAFSTGDPNEPRRAWRSSMPTEHDHSVLLDPNGQHRTAAAFDDHGEVRALGKGPDLHVDTMIPPGAYVFSMYFFEIDWPQYRHYTLRLIDKASGETLCETTAGDFVTGVYKRFLVAGPLDLKVVIVRGDSPNAQVSGLFLDEVTVPEPRLYDRLTAGTIFEAPRTRERDAPLDDARQAARKAFASLEKDGVPQGDLGTYLLRERALLRAARNALDATPRHYLRTWPALWPDAMERLARVAGSVEGDERKRAVLAIRYAAARAAYDLETAWRCADGIAALLRKDIVAGGLIQGQTMERLERITRDLLLAGRRNEARPLLKTTCTLWSELATPDAAKAKLIDMGRLALKAGVARPVAKALATLQATYGSLTPAERLLAANLHYAAGRHARALDLYQTVRGHMKAGKRHQWLLVAMLTCCLHADDVEGADKLLETLKAEYPGSKMIDEARFRFGEHYVRERLWGPAKEVFEGMKADSVTGLYDGMCDEYLKRIAHQEHIEELKKQGK